ncbi:MAG TPA: hypothetical protein VKN99_03735, partial [Polyangia bacterium]|nr:hypothetical protein [Polyangia bacterium]
GGGGGAGGAGGASGPDGGTGATHGNSNGRICGGGFGAANDLAHLPPCPSDPAGFYPRFAASRADYYHDGTHVFEPEHVLWDDALAAVAQDYANRYAAGLAPSGMVRDNSSLGYEPYWDGTYQGQRAMAGMETPTSCDCPPPGGGPFMQQGPAPVFYNLGNAYFRAEVVRIDGMSRMGIGHVGTADGRHFWTFVFGQ